jgi:preprotein translocase subunit SecD
MSVILKKVLVVCLAAAVVAGGVKLFQMRHQLFRPNAARVGGTEVVFAAEGAAGEDDLERACTVLCKRFDPIGAAGVEVRSAGSGRIAVLVPNGKRHDELVEQVRRLAAIPGRVEFGVIAHEQHDHKGLEEARKRFLSNKEGPLGGGGKERISARLAGGEAQHYRLARVSAHVARQWGLDVRGREFLVGTDRAVIPSHVVSFPVFARREGERGTVDYFVLLREPDPGREVTGESLKSVRLTHTNRSGGLAIIEFTCTEGGGERLFELTSQNLRVNPSRRSPHEFLCSLAILLDGELTGNQPLTAPVRRKGELNLGTSRAEDAAALIGGGTLPVRLREKPVAERTIDPSR